MCACYRRRGGNFRSRGADCGNRGDSSMSHHGRKIRHDSYSSSEGNGYSSLSLQQQQAINNEASNGSSDFVGRYKTELCRPFMENGECKYGEKCQFAHGRHELKQMSRHPKYKTEYCRTFHTVGFCPYGPRCHFLHLLDRDNPAQDDHHAISSCDEHSEQLSKQRTYESSGRGESISPTTIEEPPESVFYSPSPAAVSPVSSAGSTCSETNQSSGICLSSPNASVSSTSPSARHEKLSTSEETIAVTENEFPPLEKSATPSDMSLKVEAPEVVSTSNQNLLTISTSFDRQPMNFAQLQQQKQRQMQCLAMFRRQQQQQQQQQQQLASVRSVAVPNGSRLPIFSSLAN